MQRRSQIVQINSDTGSREMCLRKCQVSMSDVVEHLYNKPCNGKVVIDDEIKAAIDKYYEEYGAKEA